MEESACSSGKRTTTSKHLRHLLISDIYTYSTTYLTVCLPFKPACLPNSTILPACQLASLPPTVTDSSPSWQNTNANDRGMSCGRQLAVNGVSLLLLEHTTKFTQ
uniref:Uncharacterized protein n=1 Tax=Glossina pallidipes TaxID=7398 RepID=A0A1B0A0M4_GLOPL